jgi:hypothetical protein
MKNLRNATLAAAVVAALGAAPQVASAQAAQPGAIKWYGSIYSKFLDGNRRTEQGLYSNAETTPGEGGGDQGQGIEFELMFNAQVSKQVEIGGRIHSRFNKNYWANYGGFAVPDNDTTNCGEDDPRCNQYIKLRGAWARITPGYEWMDSLLVGNSDWGMFDPWTQGKSRYIDRDNIGGVLLQGSALGKTLRWDIARVTLANYQGSNFSTGTFGEDIYANDANYVGQLKYAPSPDWNATLIAMYARDKELEDNDPNTLNGTGVQSAFDNTVAGIRAQFTGFDFVDLSGSFYYSDYNGDKATAADGSRCDNTWNGNCRFSPVPQSSTNDTALILNANFNELLIDGLSLSAQYFDIGSDYVSITAARREADVLLTEGQEGTWQWGRPDYNFGNRANGNSMAGLGWGGWNGEVQQVVSGMADNDFTDFDEPVAHSVIGWKGITLVPKYTYGDWEFSGEYTYLDFNQNWQACGAGVGYNTGCGKYFKNEGTNAWAYGGDYRSPYSPYQDREMQIFTLKANYTLDIGNGIDLAARYKYMSDEDKRVTGRYNSTTANNRLLDAYNGFTGGVINPDWIPNVGLGGCVSCDDREVDYDTYGLSAGYQFHPDFYAKLIYELHEVELIDGTVDVAPVGLGFEGSNDFGWIEYVTGDTTKNRIALDFSYFLSGVEFGGTVDYFWGDYDPVFFTNQGNRRVRLIPGDGVTSIATPLGNIPVGGVTYGQYRMKVFMKVSF